MAVRDKDVAILRDDDVGGLIEGVGSIAGHTGLAERHQQLSVGTELEHLVSFAILTPGIGDPDVPFMVHVEPVRKDEHAGAKALEHLAGSIELHDGLFRPPRAAVHGAPVCHPDVALRVDIDGARGSPGASGRQLRPVVNRLVGVFLCRSDRSEDNDHDSQARDCRGQAAHVRHGQDLHRRGM
jgi:hypothetical protein